MFYFAWLADAAVVRDSTDDNIAEKADDAEFINGMLVQYYRARNI